MNFFKEQIKQELKLMIKLNNDYMLGDKTQFFNRLQSSNISAKSTAFGQHIKNPYLAQYKIFQERLKNPKPKVMSMIIRKYKKQQKIGKENNENQLRQILQEQCLKEARKLINKQGSNFNLFNTCTIDYDVNENSKQSEVLCKFKEKLQVLKLIKNDIGMCDRDKLRPVNLSHLTKIQRTLITSSIGSQRKNFNNFKPNTAELFSDQRERPTFKSHQSSNNNFAENKLKLPLTFVAYKRNKSFAQKFTKDRR